jgi:hypothetical protein
MFNEKLLKPFVRMGPGSMLQFDYYPQGNCQVRTIARLWISQDFLRSGHVRLACGGHVSCEDRYNPADLGDRAGLEEK